MAKKSEPSDYGAPLALAGAAGLVAVGVLLLFGRKKQDASTFTSSVHQTQPPPPSYPWKQAGWKPPPEPKGTPARPKA